MKNAIATGLTCLLLLLSVMLAGCGEKAGQAVGKGQEQKLQQALDSIERSLDLWEGKCLGGQEPKSACSVQAERSLADLNKLEVPDESESVSRYLALRDRANIFADRVAALFNHDSVIAIAVKKESLKEDMAGNLFKNADAIFSLDGGLYYEFSATAYYTAAGRAQTADTRAKAKEAMAALGLSEVIFRTVNDGYAKLTVGEAAVELSLDATKIMDQKEVVNADLLMSEANAKRAGLKVAMVDTFNGAKVAVIDEASFISDEAGKEVSAYRVNGKLFTRAEDAQTAEVLTFSESARDFIGLRAMSRDESATFTKSLI